MFKDLPALKNPQLQEFVDAQIRVMTAHYSNSKAYTSMVIVAGYAAFFWMWGFVHEDLPKMTALIAALLMALSAAVFVMFEVYKMIWVALTVRLQALAADDPYDPLKKIRALDDVLLREARVFSKVWIGVLAGTILPALGAFALLVVSILIVLVDGVE